MARNGYPVTQDIRRTKGRQCSAGALDLRPGSSRGCQEPIAGQTPPVSRSPSLRSGAGRTPQSRRCQVPIAGKTSPRSRSPSLRFGEAKLAGSGGGPPLARRHCAHDLHRWGPEQVDLRRFEDVMGPSLARRHYARDPHHWDPEHQGLV